MCLRGELFLLKRSLIGGCFPYYFLRRLTHSMRIHSTVIRAFLLSAMLPMSLKAAEAPLGVKGLEVFNQQPVRQLNGTLNVDEAVDLG